MVARRLCSGRFRIGLATFERRVFFCRPGTAWLTGAAELLRTRLAARTTIARWFLAGLAVAINRFVIEQMPALILENTRRDQLDLSGWHITQLERAIGDADQAIYLQANGFQHTADLTVLALANADGEPDIGALVVFDFNVHWPVIDAFDGDALFELVDRGLVDSAPGANAIFTVPGGGRQFECAGQSTIIGQQQQTFRGQIEATDGDHPAHILGQAIKHGGATFGIGMGGDQARRLVIAPQLGGLGGVDGLAVNLDLFLAGDLEGRGVELFAVHLYPAVLDHALDLAPRGDSGPGEEFCDAFTCRCIGSCLVSHA